MNNWEQLILRAIVPISFVAIWALTALFNRDPKGFPARPAGPTPGAGPRPGDPVMRWSAQTNQAQPANRRPPPPGEDKDMLFLPGYPVPPSRGPAARTGPGSGARRLARGRQSPASLKNVEPIVSRPRQAGVNQNVNQSIARTLEMAPLTTIAPMATSVTTLANSPSSPAKTTAILTTATIRPLMNDPARLREAFIVNELFQRPLALRGRRGHHS